LTYRELIGNLPIHSCEAVTVPRATAARL